MRILLDTNVIFSTILNPLSVPAHVLNGVIKHHDLVLCSQNVDELREIVRRKKPNLLPDTELLLAELAYELIPAIDKSNATKVIRDATDQPILNAAIAYSVDIVITGDKDFLSLDIDSPRILTCAEFLQEDSEEAA